MYSLKVPLSCYLFNGKNYKHACTISDWSVLWWGSTLLGPILCSRFKQNVINTWYIIHILSTCFSKQQNVSQRTWTHARQWRNHLRYKTHNRTNEVIRNRKESHIYHTRCWICLKGRKQSLMHVRDWAARTKAKAGIDLAKQNRLINQR